MRNKIKNSKKKEENIKNLRKARDLEREMLSDNSIEHKKETLFYSTLKHS